MCTRTFTEGDWSENALWQEGAMEKCPSNGLGELTGVGVKSCERGNAGSDLLWQAGNMCPIRLHCFRKTVPVRGGKPDLLEGRFGKNF